MKSFIAACAALSCLSAPPASETTPVAADVLAQITHASEQMHAAGYIAQDLSLGRLHHNEGRMIRLPTAPGAEYVVLGVCDTGCYDIDISISARGVELGRDSSHTDSPLVAWTAPSGESVVLRVTMDACATTPCGFGLAVFRR